MDVDCARDEVPQRIKETALKVLKSVGMIREEETISFAQVDQVMKKERRVFVLEMNKGKRKEDESQTMVMICVLCCSPALCTRSGIYGKVMTA